MDSVTQLQNYLNSITGFMTQSLLHAHHGAQTVSDAQLVQALKDERTRAAELQAEEAAAAAAAAASSTTTAAASAADGTLATTTADSSSPSVPIPDLSSPLYSGLSPSVEHAMCDRAHHLFKRVIEFDSLLQALPPLSPGEHERQMHMLRSLQEWNASAGLALEKKKEEALLWRKRVSHCLQQAAAGQLNTNTNQKEKMQGQEEKTNK